METMTYRTNPGVDPHVDVWEWQIPIYLFLGGLAAGILVIGAVAGLTRSKSWNRTLAAWGALAAIFMLSLGMLALFLDLTHKWYVYRFYLAFRPASPMSWGAWILLLAYPAMGLLLLGSLSREQWEGLVKRFALLRWLGGLRKLAVDRENAVLWLSLITGISLGTYTGILLQTLVARPLWNSGLLGPLFLASGISGAAAFLILIERARELARRSSGDGIRVPGAEGQGTASSDAGSGRTSPDVSKHDSSGCGRLRRDGCRLSLLRWDVGALAVEAVLLGLLLVEKAGGPQVDRLSAGLLLSGPFSGSFFGLVVLGGIAVPLAMEIAELARGHARTGLAAPLLVLAGGFSLRAVLVAAGLMSSFAMLAEGIA